MSEDCDRELGWVLIAPPVLAAKDLCMGEKVLLGRICGLIGKRGHCFASNKWLGEQLGFSDRTVEKYIARLVEKRYLIREYGHGGKRDRRLIPTIGGVHPYPSREDIPTRGGNHSSETDKSNREESSSGKPREKVSDEDKPIGTVPKPIMTELTETYAKLQGYRPLGTAWKPIQQGFRQRFLVDGYTKDQLIGCMERLTELGWDWTINTVRDWIGRYVAGVMPSAGNGDHPDEDADDHRALLETMASRIRSLATEINLERDRDVLSAEDTARIRELETQKRELEERARDLEAKLEARGIVAGEKVR